MNFYLLSVFVILCFGSCTIAKEVYQRLPKTSGEITTKKVTAKARSPIINGLVQVPSQAQTWIQRFRRLLKALRKWCTSHPYEVKLGKCFATYLSITVPAPGPFGKIGRYNGNPGGTEPPPKISQKSSASGWRGGATQQKIFADGFLDKRFLYFYFRDSLIRLSEGFRFYRDVLFRDNLVICVWDYFWKKFWSWVDSAPDSP